MRRLADRLAGLGERLDRVAPVALVLVGLIVGVAQVTGITALPGDAMGDWTSRPGTYILGTYVYSPLLSQLLEPLRWVGAWQVFIIGWSAICFGSAGYVFGRWSFLVLASLVPDVAFGGRDQWWAGAVETLFLGNVTMPMLAAMIAGLRHPGWQAVPLLTKITPGLVGLLWIAFRGEWRRLATGIVVTAAIVAVAFVLAPDAWLTYIHFALTNAGSPTDGPAIVGPPLVIRLPVAVVLVAFAARADQPRLVPVAAAVATIGLYGWATFASVAIAAVSPRLASVRTESGVQAGGARQRLGGLLAGASRRRSSSQPRPSAARGPVVRESAASPSAERGSR